MAVRKKTERSAPRVGRGGRYESIYSENVEVTEVTGDEDTIAALDDVSETSAASHGPANNLRRMRDACCSYLEAQGLPGRFMWIRFTESGAWEYVDQGEASIGDCTGPAALARLGAYEEHSATWHAMQVVFRAYHALRALDRDATGTAVECAMAAVQNFDRFQIQTTGIDADANLGAVHRDSNAEIAKLSRTPESVEQILEQLAKLEGYEKALWPLFVSALDQENLQPEQTTTSSRDPQPQVFYCDEKGHGRRRSMTRASFGRRLRDIRNRTR